MKMSPQEASTEQAAVIKTLIGGWPEWAEKALPGLGWGQTLEGSDCLGFPLAVSNQQAGSPFPVRMCWWG